MYMHVVCTQIHVYSSVNSLSHVMYMHVIKYVHAQVHVHVHACMRIIMYVRVPVCVFLRCYMYTYACAVHTYVYFMTSSVVHDRGWGGGIPS